MNKQIPQGTENQHASLGSVIGQVRAALHLGNDKIGSGATKKQCRKDTSPSIMYFRSKVKQGQLYTGIQQFIINAEQIGEEKKTRNENV